MKDLKYLEKYRIEYPGSELFGDSYKIYVNKRAFYVIASKDGGWEHVSVSSKNQKRTPTWEEMCIIKDMFFEDEEEVVQFYPKKSEYVNFEINTLHLWRPVYGELTVPFKTNEDK